ncbi:hypothetical protein HK097_002965, partial [Rhizophlyctis rosea]
MQKASAGRGAPTATPNPTTSAEKDSPIPSVDDFYHEKENIIPLPQGRSAALLASLYGPSTMSSSDIQKKDAHQLAQERKALERVIAQLSDEDEDPLDTYHRYLKWLQQNYPSGHPDYMKCLETAVRRFKKDARYRNDVRYLKMWMGVAMRAAEPVEVFKYMSINEIGQDLGSYYEEYANLMETLKRWEDASEIYQLGINRKAQPLERLTRKHAQFQKRWTEAKAKEAELATLDIPASRRDRDSTQPRAVLAPRERSRSSTGQPRTITSTSAVVKNAPGQGGVQVYQDREEDERRGRMVGGRGTLPTASGAGQWADYGTGLSRKKENVKEATKWQGTTLPLGQQRSNSVPRIEVYQDQSDDDAPPRQPRESNAENAMALVKEKHVRAASAPSTAKMLQSIDSDPVPDLSTTQSFKSEQREAPSVPILSAESQNTEQSAEPRRKTAKPVKLREVLRFDKSLVYANGTEMSFEEIRAAMLPPISPTPPPHPEEKIKPTTTKPPSPRTHSSNPDPSPSSTPQPPTTTQKAPFAHKAKHFASPTINTKAALADVFEMFSQPLGASGGVESSEDGKKLWVDEDETISGKCFRRPSEEVEVFRDEDDNGGVVEREKEREVKEEGRRSEKVFGDENSVPRGILKGGNRDGCERGGMENVDPRLDGFTNDAEQQDPPPKRSQKFIDASTPHHTLRRPSSRSAEDGSEDECADDYRKRFNAPPGSHPRPLHNQQQGMQTDRRLSRIRPNVDLMTPITELSYEFERSIALSTIGRVRMGGVDDQTDHFGERTIMTLDNTCTMGGVTIMGMQGKNNLNVDEAGGEGVGSENTERSLSSIMSEHYSSGHGESMESGSCVMGGEDLTGVSVGKRGVGIGRSYGAGEALGDVSGVRVTDDEDEDVGRGAGGLVGVAAGMAAKGSALSMLERRLKSWQPYKPVLKGVEGKVEKEVKVREAVVEVAKPASVVVQQQTPITKPTRTSPTTIKTKQPTAPTGKLCVPNPCNPYTATVLSALIDRFDKSVIQSPFFDCRNQQGNLGAMMEKAARGLESSKTSKKVVGKGVKKEEELVVEVEVEGMGVVRLLRKVGEGGFARCFLVEESKFDDDDEEREWSDEEDDDS